MTDLNDKTKRQELIQRYLNANTTIEEEILLKNYFTHTTDILTPEEEDVKLIIKSYATRTKDIELSEEKVEEFDRLMKEGKVGIQSHSPKNASIVKWSFLLSAAVALAIILVTKETEKSHITQQYAKTVNTTAPCTQQTKVEAKAQQKERNTLEKVTVKEYGADLPNTIILADNKKEPETNTPIRRDKETKSNTLINWNEKQDVSSSEIAQAETQALSVSGATLYEPATGLRPLNVATTNYSSGQNSYYEFTPSEATMFMTEIKSNAKSISHITISSSNGMAKHSTKIASSSFIYKIDDEWVSVETVIKLPLDSIETVRILKRGTAAAIKESPDGLTNDIILITTKKSKTYDRDNSSLPLRNCPYMTETDMINSIYVL